MRETLAMVLAGGAVIGLDPLAWHRAKAAIPIGGIYRIVDFVLSNLMHSGVPRVGVLTQHWPGSLMDHLGSGMTWEYTGRTRLLKILPPYQADDNTSWYRGNADAVWQNLNFVRDYNPRHVLVLSGEHVYQMDYSQVVHFHECVGAEATIVYKQLAAVPPGRFGVLYSGPDGRITAYVEKPTAPCWNAISLGIYCFRREYLISALEDMVKVAGRHDFARHVFEPAVARGDRIWGFPFQGVWCQLGSLQDYHDAHMAMLGDSPAIDPEAWRIRTNPAPPVPGDWPPTFAGAHAHLSESIVAPGCVVDGCVIRSVLSPGVHVQAGARVVESVLLHDVTVESGAVVSRVLADKHASIGYNARVGATGAGLPEEAATPLGSPAVTVLGRGTRVERSGVVPEGACIYPIAMEGQ